MPSAFAPELFALIVDNLHDDIDSLKSCALSASILHEPSQRLLFSSHSLAIRNVERCRGLSSLLSHSPHISTYITTLVLLSPPRVANNENWFETDTIVGTLQDLLPKFTHIRRCVWQRETRDGMVTNWTVMVRSYTLILECLARQPLRELHLRYLPFLTPMSVVLQLLSMAPTISFPTIVFWDGADIIPIPRQHPLRRLGVHSMSVVDLLLQPGLSLELSTVQDLGITIDEQVENVVEPLIAAVARTLRTLLVRITQWGGPPLVLPPCLSLEVAELLIGVDYFYECGTHPVIKALLMRDHYPVLNRLIIDNHRANSYSTFAFEVLLQHEVDQNVDEDERTLRVAFDELDGLIVDNAERVHVQWIAHINPDISEHGRYNTGRLGQEKQDEIWTRHINVMAKLLPRAEANQVLHIQRSVCNKMDPSGDVVLKTWGFSPWVAAENRR